MVKGSSGLILLIVISLFIPTQGQTEVIFEDNFSDDVISEVDWTVESDDCIYHVETNNSIKLQISSFSNCVENVHSVYLDRNVSSGSNHIITNLDYNIQNMGFIGLTGYNEESKLIFQGLIYDGWAAFGISAE